MNSGWRPVPTMATSAALPLVLLPGTLCDARLFAPMLDRLDVDTIVHATLDGGSDPAGVAAHLLAALPPRFALLGFSLGGIVAMEMAAQAPGRIAGLALLDSNARAVPPETHEARRAAALPAAGESIRDVIARLWPTYVAPAAHDDAALRGLIADMAADAGVATLARQTEIALARASSLDRLAAFAMPTLVMAGAEDALCPPAMQHELAERLPDATLALIPGVGHFAPLEAPDRVAGHVAGWLARVDAFAR